MKTKKKQNHPAVVRPEIVINVVCPHQSPPVSWTPLTNRSGIFIWR